jgi:8-oxo-dGTP pyrophosphatase MutT (NUDIX family)
MREAAVAVVLSGGDAGDEILVIRRAEFPGDPWSGHIALPGGGREPQDSSLEATARRETLEETGIDLSASKCIAALATVEPVFKGAPVISIAPFVFRHTGAKLVTMSSELVESWWIPVAEFQREGVWETVTVATHAGTSMSVRGFRWQGHVLWGLTERILYDFLNSLPNIARNELAARVADVKS